MVVSASCVVLLNAVVVSNASVVLLATVVVSNVSVVFVVGAPVVAGHEAVLVGAPVADARNSRGMRKDVCMFLGKECFVASCAEGKDGMMDDHINRAFKENAYLWIFWDK